MTSINNEHGEPIGNILDKDVLNCLNDMSEEMVNFTSYFVPQEKQEEAIRNWNIILGKNFDVYFQWKNRAKRHNKQEKKEIPISDKDLITDTIRDLYEFRDEKTKELDRINQQINEKFSEAVRNFPIGMQCYDADGDIFEAVGYQIKPEPSIIGLYRNSDKAVPVCILDIHII